MRQAGGRITITMGGVQYSPRGKAMINSSGVANSAVANHDGTVSRYTTAKPVAPNSPSTAARRAPTRNGRSGNSTMMLGFYNVTLAEIDANVLHTFANASIVGQPKIDSETGEVTGLSILTDDNNYQQTNIA